MTIKTVTDDDIDFVMSIDKHVNKESYRNRVYTKSGYVLWEANQRIGIMSTQVDEDAQHLYRKSGYIDCGGLVFNGTPFEQPMELFLRKIL